MHVCEYTRKNRGINSQVILLNGMETAKCFGMYRDGHDTDRVSPTGKQKMLSLLFTRERHPLRRIASPPVLDCLR